MKTHSLFFTFSFLGAMLLSVALPAQDYNPADSTGLPGDHFSLEGALDLFKKSQSLEEFEKLLNTEDNHVNNLDLNEDGKIDYIRVVDRIDGTAHSIVLQVPVSQKESQDVAAIEIEKNGAESAVLQIVGDESLYGKQVTAEPSDESDDPGVKRGGRGGPAWEMPPMGIIVNVWFWSPIRFIYRPAYVPYVSPWYWGYYPGFWHPWRPYPWGWFHARVRPYWAHYRVVNTCRVTHAHAIYVPHRTTSTIVTSRSYRRVETAPARRGRVQPEGHRNAGRVAKPERAGRAGRGARRGRH
jgi:hypothetical protein